METIYLVTSKFDILVSFTASPILSALNVFPLSRDTSNPPLIKPPPFYTNIKTVLAMTTTLSTPLHFLLITLTIFAILPPYNSTYLNYADALSKSILFFEGQRSGFLPGDQRLSWRQNSGLADGYGESVELTGGYYDAGDNVKFGFPMAFTTTMLAWSVIEFGDVMPPGELRNALVAVRWATDYLLKTVAVPGRIYVQVNSIIFLSH